ncbi:hypothetical protein GW17_00014953 [Ensete ventricosum]|nr:hypothetical protein GW17_00014953 [Ensete ventricosum]
MHPLRFPNSDIRAKVFVRKIGFKSLAAPCRCVVGSLLRAGHWRPSLRARRWQPPLRAGRSRLRPRVAAPCGLLTARGGVSLQRSIMWIPLERRMLDLLHLLHPDLEYRDIRSP